MIFIGYKTSRQCRPNEHCRPNAFIYMAKCRPNAAITHTPDHDFHNLQKTKIYVAQMRIVALVLSFT